MSNSLRSNAERLLGDVQRVHSRLVAQIERVERAAGGAAPRSGALARAGDPGTSAGAPRGPPTRLDGDDGLDVPEFIPPG